MVLGEAVPRDKSEAVTVEFSIPGDATPVTMTIRRGFVGTVPVQESGSPGYEGRQLTSIDISGWDGDRPRYAVRTEPAGPY